MRPIAVHSIPRAAPRQADSAATATPLPAVVARTLAPDALRIIADNRRRGLPDHGMPFTNSTVAQVAERRLFKIVDRQPFHNGTDR